MCVRSESLIASRVGRPGRFASALRRFQLRPVMSRSGGVTAVNYNEHNSRSAGVMSDQEVAISGFGDRLAQTVADLDGAGIVHTGPDPGVVPIRIRWTGW